MLLATLLLAGITVPLDAMPPGYHLQAFDDCGVTDLQPHVLGGDTHTFTADEVKGDAKARTVAWDWKHLDLRYQGLDPQAGWVVAVTYANEAFNARVQSLWAGKTQLHGPKPLPRGGSERLLFRLSPEAFEGGTLLLSCRLEGPVNVVVSAVELWAPLPSPPTLRLRLSAAPYAGFTGQVLDLTCDPVADADVTLAAAGHTVAQSRSGADGGFAFDPTRLAGLPPEATAEVTAAAGGRTVSRALPVGDVHFEPLRYRPVPTAIEGVRQCRLSLDGAWRLSSGDTADARAKPLSDAVWRPFRVPGQFRQQGYDLPANQPVAVATEVAIPADWRGRQIVLRFDAVQGAGRYWLNGTPVGRSDNLFTPVELDVTAAARPGQSNRLDLEILADTLSERLSHANGYAFHNLAGIPRKVQLLALPSVHVRSLRLRAGLDDSYSTGQLRLDAAVGSAAPLADVTLTTSLSGPGLAQPLTAQTAANAPVTLTLPQVQPWSAEKPRLYDLRLELRQGGRTLERIERQVGFTRIEVRGRQLYLNGRRIKLAGACHHETDPLTGRADTARHAADDVRLMRGANLNYLRTSHYPPTEELLDAADRQGIYVEVEAPFCWVEQREQIEAAREVLTPTAAMVDFCAGHPSVLLWSLANESAFNPVFELSNRLVHELDPTRPVTFNHPFSREAAARCTDIANLHYPGQPYDALLPDDPRPLLLDEHFFPICHEQTDARVDPALRELWGFGHADPASDWSRRWSENYVEPGMREGGRPGTWSDIVHSDRVIGGAIWAAFDDAFYFPDGQHAGYAWHHGFWGVIDSWRRPKPEWWLAKMIFSPVWFPQRQLPFAAGRRSASLPVENRFSFTDLSELRFEWQAGKGHGPLKAALPPGQTGAIELPVPVGAQAGDTLVVRVTNATGELLNALEVTLGQPRPVVVPAPTAGPPARRDDGAWTTLSGDRFALRLNRTSGELDSNGLLRCLPRLHLSRYDYGDFDSAKPPYALLPDDATRHIDAVTLTDRADGLELVVKDRWDGFAGQVTWLLDRHGVGRVSYDYLHSGPELSAREIGLKLLLEPACDELRWRRWSEWGVFPADDIGRTVGTAKARRPAKWPDQPEGKAPAWPWALDQTELGTSGFRGIKFCVYHAGLHGPRGGVTLHAAGDRHARACLDPHGVWLHLIADCRLAPLLVRPGQRLTGSFALTLDAAP